MDMILTNIGEELASNGFLTGVFPKVTRVSFGDGNGNMVIPDKTMTSLVHQIQNGVGTVLARLANPNRLYIYTQIPANIGGITIREVGLFTEDNTLIAIGGNFEKIKPPVNESTEKFDFYITVPISSAQDITVEFSNDNLYASQEAIDVIATQEEVNRVDIKDIKLNLLPLKLNTTDVVNTLTSTLTNKPLSAAQGKVLKDMINTINNLLLSDNTTLDSLQEVVDFIEMNRDTLNTLGISNIAGLQNALNNKLGVTAQAVDSAKLNGRIFNWSGQGGQPNWLWGGNDGTNMYVWNPSNFSVNYANNAGSVNSLANHQWGSRDYDRLSTGNIIQRGAFYALANAVGSISFPVTFPNECIAVVITSARGPSNGYVKRVESFNTFSFSYSYDVFAAGSNPNVLHSYIAIGR